MKLFNNIRYVYSKRLGQEWPFLLIVKYSCRAQTIMTTEVIYLFTEKEVKKEESEEEEEDDDMGFGKCIYYTGTGSCILNVMYSM